MNNQIDTIIDNLFYRISTDIERLHNSQDSPAQFHKTVSIVVESAKKTLSDYLESRLLDREIAVYKQFRAMFRDDIGEDYVSKYTLEYLDMTIEKLQGMKHE